MTNPPEIFNAPAAGSCDAVQWEISQALDESRPFSGAAGAHLHSCAECAAFTSAWMCDGGLAGPLAEAPGLDPAVTDRLLLSIRAEDTHASPSRRRSTPGTHLLRWAAVFALGGLGWRLLDPQLAPTPARAPSPFSASLAMNRQAARLEQPLTREQAALQGDLATGAARLHDILAWSSGVLR